MKIQCSLAAGVPTLATLTSRSCYKFSFLASPKFRDSFNVTGLTFCIFSPVSFSKANVKYCIGVLRTGLDRFIGFVHTYGDYICC